MRFGAQNVLDSCVIKKASFCLPWGGEGGGGGHCEAVKQPLILAKPNNIMYID